MIQLRNNDNPVEHYISGDGKSGWMDSGCIFKIEWTKPCLREGMKEKEESGMEARCLV